MLHLSITNAFQAYCAGAALFEIITIVKLLLGDLMLPDAGAWVDRNYNANNKPVLYVFVAMLACLVVSRVMACVLPKSRMIIAYLVLAHVFESGLYICCCTQKEDALSSPGYISLTRMVVDTSLFVAQLAYLEVQRTKAESADIKWREEQLAIIRKKRAEYSKKKEKET